MQAKGKVEAHANTGPDETERGEKHKKCAPWDGKATIQKGEKALRYDP